MFSLPGMKSSSKTPRMEDTYKLGKVLGKGNYSEVRLCTKMDTKLNYAVKVMTKSKLTKEDLDAIKTEVGILQELVQQKSVIRYVDSFDEAKFYYLITELMEGGELFDRIVELEHYSENDTRKVVKTIGECLLYMHNKKIVHRDLKPENILLKDKSADSMVKIADFGFAVHVPAAGCRTSCGTPG